MAETGIIVTCPLHIERIRCYKEAILFPFSDLTVLVR